jgi:hypothetical protein
MVFLHVMNTDETSLASGEITATVQGDRPLSSLRPLKDMTDFRILHAGPADVDGGSYRRRA